jgi:hypothetical protein
VRPPSQLPSPAPPRRVPKGADVSDHARAKRRQRLGRLGGIADGPREWSGGGAGRHRGSLAGRRRRRRGGARATTRSQHDQTAGHDRGESPVGRHASIGLSGLAAAMCRTVGPKGSDRLPLRCSAGPPSRIA